MREEEEYRISNKEFQMSKVGILLKKAEKGEDEGGREQQNIEYRIINNEVGKKEINVWEKFFTVIDIVCIISRAASDRFFRQKSGDRSQESELVLVGIVGLGECVVD